MVSWSATPRPWPPSSGVGVAHLHQREATIAAALHSWKKAAMEFLLTPDLRGRLESIEPIVLEYRGWNEEHGRLHPAVHEALKTANLYGVYAPKALGGLECEPLDIALAIEQLARWDSAVGWALVNHSAAMWYGSRFTDALVADMFGARRVVPATAAAFNPPLAGTKVEGGYSISGEMPFVSNCHHAEWFAFLCRDAALEKTFLSFLPKERVAVKSTWDALGMRGTGSDHVAVTKVFVPDAHLFFVTPQYAVHRDFEGPLYRYPAMGMLSGVTAPVILAIALEAVRETDAIVRTKKPFASSLSLRDNPKALCDLGYARSLVDMARTHLYWHLARAWEKTRKGEGISLGDKANLLGAGIQCLTQASRAVEMCFQLAGSHAVYESKPLARLFRDAQVLKHHGHLNFQRFETFSKAHWGEVDSSFGIVAL